MSRVHVYIQQQIWSSRCVNGCPGRCTVCQVNPSDHYFGQSIMADCVASVVGCGSGLLLAEGATPAESYSAGTAYRTVVPYTGRIRLPAGNDTRVDCGQLNRST